VLERDATGRTALHYAATTNDRSAAHALIADEDTDLNVADPDGFTPLHFAAKAWSVEVARLLLEAGAEVDPVTNRGETPLYHAVFNSRGRGEMIELLLEHGADPERPNNSGQTPIGFARMITNYDLLEFFEPREPEAGDEPE
jgi:ankyrin repeat protein